MRIMLPQIIVIGLFVWLMNTSKNVKSDKVYSGPDKVSYEKYSRRIIPGSHQQLMAFQNTAYVYGGYGFDINCDDYKWVVFDGHRYDDREIKCTIIGRGIYRFDSLQPCKMQLVYMMQKDLEEPLWNAFRVPLYVKTQCDQPLQPVISHFVVSAGPGWLVIRFPITNFFMYMAAYRLVYRKIGDKRWIKTRMNEYIVWGRILPRVKPNIPCPPWREYSMFCLMVTDHIRVVDVPYLTYEAQIQGVGLITAEEYDFSIVNYKFTFRAFNCDVFSEGKCPPPFGPLQPDPIGATMSDWDYMEMVAGQPWTLRPMDREKLEELEREMKRKKWSNRDVSMMVLGCFLLLILLLLLFLAMFFCAKRRARERTLTNWYFISSDTWPVNYTLRLPPGLPRSDKGLAGRGADDDVHMDVISQRPVMGLGAKHRTYTDEDKMAGAAPNK